MRTSIVQAGPHRNAGSAVVVMIMLLAIMLIYVLANLKTLHYMKREIKLIEKRQIQRLQSSRPILSGMVTNASLPPLGNASGEVTR